ncbi:hypothetical protein LPJ57_000048 [Coemansia sp. RSA 486]|nr:hypothetical protein LPJ57_000048 [Coemansia sp. RSA 486]
MSDTNNGGPTLSKSEAAELVAHWATHELGFRKPSTLVSTKGEDKLTAADIEPLLQGELAGVLEQLATHIVSSQKSAQTRSMLASYSAQPEHSNAAGRPVAYLALRKSLDGIRERENALLSDISSMETRNLEAIGTIDELEAQKIAMQGRIKELRFRILVKQAMAEKIRRLSERMKILIRETKLAGGGSRAATKTEPLFDLLDSIQAQAKADSNGTLLGADSYDDVYQKRQALVANLITDIKNLVDRHIQAHDALTTLESRLAVEKAQLADKIEAIAGKLSTVAAFTGDAACDYKGSVLQLILQSTQAHVQTRVDALVPELEASEPGVWDKGNHCEKVHHLAYAHCHYFSASVDLTIIQMIMR